MRVVCSQVLGPRHLGPTLESRCCLELYVGDAVVAAILVILFVVTIVRVAPVAVTVVAGAAKSLAKADIASGHVHANASRSRLRVILWHVPRSRSYQNILVERKGPLQVQMQSRSGDALAFRVSMSKVMVEMESTQLHLEARSSKHSQLRVPPTLPATAPITTPPGPNYE